MAGLWLWEYADGWFCDSCDRWQTCHTCPVTKSLVEKILWWFFWWNKKKETNSTSSVDYEEESIKRQKFLYWWN